MSLLWGACVAVLLAGAVGFGFVLIWHPIQDFIRLRDRIGARVAEIERQRNRSDELTRETEALRAVVSRAKAQQLVEAERDLLDLADQIGQFPAKYPVATWILKRRFDPSRASAGLNALASTIKREREFVTNRQRHHIHRTAETVEVRRHRR